MIEQLSKENAGGDSQVNRLIQLKEEFIPVFPVDEIDGALQQKIKEHRKHTCERDSQTIQPENGIRKIGR